MNRRGFLKIFAAAPLAVAAGPSGWEKTCAWLKGLKDTKIVAGAVDYATGIVNFTHAKLPIIRNIAPSLIANDIVSVQPMVGPSSAVYFMKDVGGFNLNRRRYSSASLRSFPKSSLSPMVGKGGLSTCGMGSSKYENRELIAIMLANQDEWIHKEEVCDG